MKSTDQNTNAGDFLDGRSQSFKIVFEDGEIRAVRTPISEAIDVSVIDRAARLALKQGISDETKNIWDEFYSRYQKSHKGDIHDAYDVFSREVYEEKYANRLENVCSRILTQVTRKHLEDQYGPMIRRKDAPGVWVDEIEVIVEDREKSDDKNKAYGGYFRSGSTLIKVFVNESQLIQEFTTSVQMHVFGESFDRSDAIVKLVVPIFVHEYTHLEQHLRGGHKQGIRDRGYITIGGGKFGNRRNPNGGELEYLRYISSSKEIESFAADTASAIMNAENVYNANEHIAGALESMASGYGVDTFENYISLKYDAFEGRFAKLGLNTEEMEYVFRRYLTLVYKKLQQFKEDPRQSKKDPLVWRVAAQKSLKEAAWKIAEDVASKMVADSPYETEADYMMRYPGQRASDAVMFLQRRYFRDQWDFDLSKKLENAFYKILRIQLQRILKARTATDNKYT